jgi:hypothetical protein
MWNNMEGRVPGLWGHTERTLALAAARKLLASLKPNFLIYKMA